MKTCRINITHKSPVFRKDDILAAFQWLTDKMNAIDLAECHEVSVNAQVGMSQVNFSLIGANEPAPPPPAPDPDDTPTEPELTDDSASS